MNSLKFISGLLSEIGPHLSSEKKIFKKCTFENNRCTYNAVPGDPDNGESLHCLPIIGCTV